MNPSHQYTRDPRLDFFRGLALVCIFVDHTPGNRLTAYTVRNLGFSDASELFVFISAYTAGMVYMARAGRDGLAAASRRIWQRVAQIYGAHIVLLVTASALAGWLTRTLGDPAFVNGMNVAPFLAHPREMFLEALTLTFQPTFMNILPLYIVLLGFLPLILWLIRRSQMLAVLLSLLVYMLAREFPAVMDNPLGTTWQFNPLGWQMLFMVGVSLGASARRSAGDAGGPFRVPRSRVLFALAAAYAIAAFWIGADAWTLDGSSVDIPRAIHALFFPVMDRANLSLWRLAHILALAYLAAWFFPAESAVFRSWVSRPLILCGQHSLPLFCVGVLLSIAGWAAFARFGSGLPVQLIVNVGGFAILVAVAWLLSLRPRSRNVAPAMAPVTG